MSVLASEIIDGKTYTVNPLSASDAIELGATLGEIMGPTFATLAANARSSVGSDVFGQAIAGMFTRLRVHGTKKLISKILEPVEEDGTPIGKSWDYEFRGRIATLVKVTVFAAKGQFGNFSEALESLGLPNISSARNPGNGVETKSATT